MPPLAPTSVPLPASSTLLTADGERIEPGFAHAEEAATPELLDRLGARLARA